MANINVYNVYNSIRKAVMQYELKDSDLGSQIRNASGKLWDKDDPLKNESRRYFETKLSLSTWQSMEGDQGIYDSLKRLGLLMSDFNPEYKYEKSDVKSLDDVYEVIAKVRGFGDDTDHVHMIVTEICTVPNGIYSRKDRGSKRENITKKNSALHSSSPGIIRANSPVPFDETMNSRKNRIVDIFNIDASKSNGYSKSTKHIPFVNSVSGTAIAMVATLKRYIERYKESESLEVDVNNILKVFVSFTCMNGYHSICEMVDVFRSKEVVTIFDDHNIEVNLNNIFKGVLNNAFCAASNYSTIVNSKKMINKELAEFSKLSSDLVRPTSLPRIKSFKHFSLFASLEDKNPGSLNNKPQKQVDFLSTNQREAISC